MRTGGDHLPWGRNGRFPDQLVPPTQPTDLDYGVVRLTLKPRPCNTGVAVIQLSTPLDGSEALQVLTYDAKGDVRGSYPDLTALLAKPAEKQPHDYSGRSPTSDRREMVDGSGQRWAMSGHRSFELEEIGGFGNRITVSYP